MTDAFEASGQDVQQEAFDELRGGQTHGALAAIRGFGLHAEQHIALIDADDALVGDGHPMGVAAEWWGWMA